MTVACELEGVTVVHAGAVPALRDVSLRVAPGQTVALLGPSGAGKTTLLRVLAGLTPADGGRVRLQGSSPEELRAAGTLPGAVGMLHQQLDLVPQLSARANIHAGALGRRSLRRALAALLLPVEDPAVVAAAAEVGVEAMLGRRVAALSGGERQRVAIARLLVQDPAIMLVDEPVSALDPARADALVALLCRLAADHGKTLVASLHVPELARRHVDRVIGLRGGAVVFDLPTGDLTDDLLVRVYGSMRPVPSA
jgi:phosphonate transport system ATP-binding protein